MVVHWPLPNCNGTSVTCGAVLSAVASRGLEVSAGDRALGVEPVCDSRWCLRATTARLTDDMDCSKQ